MQSVSDMQFMLRILLRFAVDLLCIHVVSHVSMYRQSNVGAESLDAHEQTPNRGPLI